MNNESLQILIEPRTDARECMNANTITFELKSRNSAHYQFDLALPCTDAEICRLMSMYIDFEITSADRVNQRCVTPETFTVWTRSMQEALTQMRSVENLDRDLKQLGAEYRHRQLELVKFLKNKYQFGLKETKILVDIYFATL